MLTWAKDLTQSTKLKLNGAIKFKQKLSFSFEVGNYLVKTASSSRELIESFKLRHQVFFNEFQELSGPGHDFDKYDFIFDHLIIIHQPTKKIIGTYRLSIINKIKDSYTANEFDIESILNLKGPHLELGRACIRKDHRKGSVISLLWRGIAEYMNLSGAEVLFGCSSLKIDHPREAALVYKKVIDDGYLDQNINCPPTSAFQMNSFDTWFRYFNLGLEESHAIEAEELIPSLLKSYLKLGAQIVAEPAFDREFNCIDMLTVLRKENLANSLARKFQVNKNE